jgi:hypothetical protein
MGEYFVWANSNAAPFFSDESTGYIEADSPQSALDLYVFGYDHPAGLYAANVYENADAYHKRQAPLARFISDRASAREDGLPHDCGEWTTLAAGNIADGVDEHRCDCGERMAVTMR